MDASTGLLVAAAVIMAIGCALQAAVGFGFALFSAPLLLLIDPHFVPGPILLAAIPLCIWSWWRERSAAGAQHLRPLLLGAVLGTLSGVAALKLAFATPPVAVFGLLILAAVAVSLVSAHLRPTARNLAVSATVGGWMGAISGVHGPPVALVLQHAEPPAVRALLGAYFAVAYTLAVAALWITGLFDGGSLVRAAVLLPGTFAGLIAGPWLTPYLDRGRSRIAILGLSAASAILLIVR